MKLRSSVFGWKSVWMDLAEEMQGEFTDGTYLTEAKLPLQTKPWKVHMKMHSHPIGKSIAETTVIALPYKPMHEFKVALHNSSAMEEVGKIFGVQDVVVGEAAFDKAFIVQGSNPALLREVFADAALCELFLNQKAVNLTTIDHQHKNYGINPPSGVNVLAFAEKGAINSFDRLNGIFELLTATIERLVHLDIAARQAVDFE
ncbi:MAG TPA: hypothetical protein V6C97_23525 [Oculatellaceae cyanobacterium]